MGRYGQIWADMGRYGQICVSSHHHTHLVLHVLIVEWQEAVRGEGGSVGLSRLEEGEEWRKSERDMG